MEPYSEKVMEHFRNPRNVGEIPDADGVGKVGNPVCVSPDTLIHTNNKIEEIQGVREGGRVLSHNGRYNRISSVFCRNYSGRAYLIRAGHLGQTLVTPEHHILSQKMSPYRYKFENFEKVLPDWHMAKELKKGDFLLYPIPKEVEDKKYLKLDIPKPKWDFKSRALPEKINIDEHFLRLVGYYLSEGYVRTDRCKGTVGFVFGAKDGKFIEDTILIMQRIFGLRPKNIRNSHNSVDITYYSARLARFFEREFGKGAENKCLPHWAITLPIEKQKAILCGLWRGDGYINNRVAKYVTISKQLAYSIRLLLLRQKIIFSFLTVPEKGIHRENYCIYVKEEASLKKLAEIYDKGITRPKKIRDTHKSWFDEDFFYTPIRRMTTVEYNGPVYNLEVENAHSYVSDALALHNCGDIMNLYIKVVDGIIVDAKFKTFGCGAAIATSSMVTELVKGKPVDEALKISNKAVAEALGGLPKIKMHCSVLAEEALQSAIKDYYERRGIKKEFPPLHDDHHNHEGDS